MCFIIFFFQAEDGIRDGHVTGVQTCALPISRIISEAGMTLQSPRWLNADELAVHARGYSTRAGFYRVDAESGRIQLIAHEGLSGEGAFHLDSSKGQIIFSRYDEIGRAACRERRTAPRGGERVQQ